MDAVFLKIVNLSITASWLILAVILVRLLLKKAPKWISCILWALVAFRLICPFSIESTLSLIPSSETIPKEIFNYEGDQQHDSAWIDVVNNPVFSQSVSLPTGQAVSTVQMQFVLATLIWISGIALILLYALVSYIRLKRSVGASISVKDNILVCDEVKSPFILGIIRPQIYVPSSMEGTTLEYVITHEKAHVKRHDHWWKPLGFLLLAVYWFNPLCWIAYILLCRDIEMACDEKVIREMDSEDKAGYSQALLDSSFPRRRIAACPLAFGEVGVKERVKAVLSYRKPAFWIIIAAIIACIIVSVCFLTSPLSGKSLSGKLGASMDMAVMEAEKSAYSDDHFVAMDYDVLKISKRKGQTTVYAIVYYGEYTFDGNDAVMDSGSRVPTAVTFDTSDDGSDSSVYDVIEYWVPGDGDRYPEDIREKFPLGIRGKAFDVSGAERQKEKCLNAAREYFGVNDGNNNIFGNDYGNDKGSESGEEMTPANNIDSLFASGDVLLTLELADGGEYKTYPAGEWYADRLENLMKNYIWTELDVPSEESGEFHLTAVSQDGTKSMTFLDDEGAGIVQYSDGDITTCYLASTEYDGKSIAWDVRRDYDNLDVDCSRIVFSLDGSAEEAADYFVHSAYGSHMMSLAPENQFGISDYEVVEWEVLDVSEAGDAVLGSFEYAFIPWDYNSAGIWAGNTSEGTGEYEGKLTKYHEFVLQHKEDGYWHCIDLGTGGSILP